MSPLAVLHGFLLFLSENTFEIVFWAMIVLLPLPFVYRALTRVHRSEPLVWLWSVADSAESVWFLWFHQIVYDTRKANA